MGLVLWVVLLLLIGCIFFTLVGVIGLYRLPDVYTRAHAVAKADTLGAGFAVLAVGVTFGAEVTLLKAGLLLAIIFVANPTAIHLLVRSAYSQGVPVQVRDDSTGRQE